MLRKMLLTALGLMAVSAWIAAAKAGAPGTPGSRPAPAEKAQSASDLDDPFGNAPSPPAKAAKNAEAGDDESDPFGGPAPKGLTPDTKPPVPAQKAAAAQPAAKKPRPAPAVKIPLHCGETAILKAMEEKTSLDFDEIPLEDVIDRLQNEHRIPIMLDAKALKEAGIEPDAPVTCWIHDLPLRSALRIMLGNLKLEWTIWSNVVWITSPEKAESDEFRVVKVYDVSDLVAETRDRPYRGNGLPGIAADDLQGPEPDDTPPYIVISPMSNAGGMGGMGGGMGGMGGMGGGMFAVPPEANVPAVSPLPGSAVLPTVCGAVPVVGSAERGDASRAAFATGGAASQRPERPAVVLRLCHHESCQLQRRNGCLDGFDHEHHCE